MGANSDHQKFVPWMRRALALAKRAEGFTSPNPAVGAVILKNGKVIGEGYHHQAGQPHAEIMALADAKKRGNDVAGATMVVTLEPCCHYGKTPPCMNAIIEAKIAKVVVGMADPNPCVAGCGILGLREAGVEVITDVLENCCQELNEPFVHKITTGKPLVIMKAACSLDGKIATRTGHSQWISGPEALKYAHRLRKKYDAICVGLGTVLADDPQLTYRGPGKAKHPLRIILDSKGRIPMKCKQVSGDLPGQTLIATTRKSGAKFVKSLEAKGVQVVVLPSEKGYVSLPALVAYLAKMDIMSLVIEGGGTVFASAIEAQIVDRVRMILAPMIIGGDQAVSVVGGLGAKTLDFATRFTNMKVSRLGKDFLFSGSVVKPGAGGLSCLPD